MHSEKEPLTVIDGDAEKTEVGIVAIVQGKTLIGIRSGPKPFTRPLVVRLQSAHEVLRFPSQSMSALGRISTVLTTIAIPLIGLGSKDAIDVDLVDGVVWYEVPVEVVRGLIDASRGSIASAH